MRALIDVMEHEGARGHVYNIGNTDEISMNDLAKTVREMCGSRSEIVHIPYEQAYEEGFEDMPRRVPDLSKIGQAIGWKPTIPLARILSDVIEYYRGNAAEGVSFVAPSVPAPRTASEP